MFLSVIKCNSHLNFSRVRDLNSSLLSGRMNDINFLFNRHFLINLKIKCILKLN